MVISIIMVIVGVVSFVGLPVAQYPNIVPPEIAVNTTYVGADALNGGTVRRNAHRAADERRGSHELHVLPECEQWDDEVDGQLRHQHRSEHRSGVDPDAAIASRVPIAVQCS